MYNVSNEVWAVTYSICSELNNAIDWLLDIRTESTTIYITFLNFLVLMDDA